MTLISPTRQPLPGDTEFCEVYFFVQKCTKQLMRASTQVDGARLIDLVMASESLVPVAQVTTHNGIHDVEKGCPHTWCREVGKSDHLLTEIVIDTNVNSGGEHAEQFCNPHGFHDPDRWAYALCLFNPLARVLCALLFPDEDLWLLRGGPRNQRRQEADVVSTCFEVLCHLALLCWITSASTCVSKRRKLSNESGAPQSNG